MLNLNDHSHKLEMEYPCTWRYKVIGREPATIRQAIADVMLGDKHSVTFSNKSSKGKYHCLNVELTVIDEAHRTLIFDKLKKHPDIQMVL